MNETHEKISHEFSDINGLMGSMCLAHTSRRRPKNLGACSEVVKRWTSGFLFLVLIFDFISIAGRLSTKDKRWEIQKGWRESPFSVDQKLPPKIPITRAEMASGNRGNRIYIGRCALKILGPFGVSYIPPRVQREKSRSQLAA